MSQESAVDPTTKATSGASAQLAGVTFLTSRQLSSGGAQFSHWRERSHDVFALISSHPETNPRSRKPSNGQAEPPPKEWVRTQARTFTEWINNQLAGSEHRIRDVTQDLSDGLVLLALLERLSGATIYRRQRNPRTRVQQLENMTIAFQCMREASISLIAIGPENIVDKDLSLTLGLVWKLILKYQFRIHTHHAHKDRGPSNVVLSWFQSSLPRAKIRNFTKDWSNGINLSGLVDYCEPGLIPNHASLDPNNALENITRAMALAEEKFDVPQVMHPEDLAVEKPDELSVMTYLSYFCCPGSIGEKVLLRWLQVTLPQQGITNLTTDWQDGRNLCVLVDLFLPSSVLPKDVSIAMDLAEKQLGVKSLLSPQDFSDPSAHQLAIMAYLTQFRFLEPVNTQQPIIISDTHAQEVLKPQPHHLQPVVERVQVCAVQEHVLENVPEPIPEPVVECVQVREPALEHMQVLLEPASARVERVQERVQEPTVELVQEESSSASLMRLSPFSPPFPPPPGEGDEPETSAGGDDDAVPHLPPLVPPPPPIASGKGLQQAVVGMATEFTVWSTGTGGQEEGEGEGEEALCVEVWSPQGVCIKTQCTKIPLDGGTEYAYRFTPLVTGIHAIHIKWHGSHIESSPYRCTTFDPKRCVAKGKGLNEASVNKPAFFQVNTKQAGPSQLSATVYSSSTPVELALLSQKDGLFRYQYMPQDVGRYTIHLKWGGVPIPGSPFHVRAERGVEVDKCVLKEAPQDHVRVYQPISISVDTKQAGKAELTASVRGPEGARDSCEVLEMGECFFMIMFIPQRVGEHLIDICYGGFPIPSSPLRLTVNDPSKCWLDLALLLSKTYEVDEHVSFEVLTERAGEGEITATVRGPSSTQVCRVTQGRGRGTGRAVVEYMPSEHGRHHFDLFFDGDPLPERSIAIQVEPSRAEGIILTRPFSPTGHHPAGQQLEFIVLAPNHDGEKLSISAVGERSKKHAQTWIKPSGSDTYTLYFQPSIADTYRVDISYQGRSVSGSPFSLVVVENPQPDKVVLCDPVVPLDEDKPIELMVNTRAAGEGRISAEVRVEQGGKVVESRLEEISPGLHLLTFHPPQEGVFLVSVLWSGSHVPGSPLPISYLRRPASDPPVTVTFEPEVGVRGQEGGERCVVTAELGGQNVGHVPVEVRQVERGRYQLSFHPPHKDVYHLHVFVNQREVRGSPFCLDLVAPRGTLPRDSASVGVYVEGRRLGVFSAVALGQRCGPVPVGLRYLPEKGMIHMEFVDARRDTYQLETFWNHRPFKGSPFQVKLA